MKKTSSANSKRNSIATPRLGTDIRHATRSSLLEESHDGRPSRHLATEVNSPSRNMIIEDLSDDKNSETKVQVVRLVS